MQQELEALVQDILPLVVSQTGQPNLLEGLQEKIVAPDEQELINNCRAEDAQWLQVW